MTSKVSVVALFAAIPMLLSASSAHAGEDGGTTKRLPGGAVLHLAPGTKIELARTLKLPLGPTGSEDTVTQVVKLISGRVDVDVPVSRVPKTAVLFQAPHKVSGVAKGGHSVAIVEADHATFAAVDGDMLAATGNDWKPVPSGTVRGFVGSDPTRQDHPVPGVPVVTVPHALLLAVSGGSLATPVQLNPVAQADHYEVSVWRAGDKTHELVQRSSERSTSSSIAGLAPGRYEVTARAVDSVGIAGKDSAPHSLRVVGTELPEGARFENGAILLGQHGRVKLVGADGLEASYGSSSHFVHAPGTVGLARGESTVVRLREPGGTEEVHVGLEPRALHAEVAISPKSAHWPQDKIEVSVRLFDARGQTVPETVQVKASVLVDVQPIEVSWARSGNVLTAQIPPATGRGPWVVRVEVTDEFGDPVGRDFLEIAGPENVRISAR